MTALILDWLMTLLRAWIAMLVIGAIHHDVWPPLPAFGWWGTLLIVVLFDTLFSGSVASGLAQHKAVHE